MISCRAPLSRVPPGRTASIRVSPNVQGASWDAHRAPNAGGTAPEGADRVGDADGGRGGILGSGGTSASPTPERGKDTQLADNDELRGADATCLPVRSKASIRCLRSRMSTPRETLAARIGTAAPARDDAVRPPLSPCAGAECETPHCNSTQHSHARDRGGSAGLCREPRLEGQEGKAAWRTENASRISQCSFYVLVSSNKVVKNKKATRALPWATTSSCKASGPARHGRLGAGTHLSPGLKSLWRAGPLPARPTARRSPSAHLCHSPL